MTAAIIAMPMYRRQSGKRGTEKEERTPHKKREKTEGKRREGEKKKAKKKCCRGSGCGGLGSATGRTREHECTLPC
jgi:hypothetical protein